MVIRTLLLLALIFTFRCTPAPAPASAADRPFHQMPDAVDIPDTARFIIYDPTLPADDEYRKARNATGALVKGSARPPASQVTYTHPDHPTVSDALDHLLGYLPTTISSHTFDMWWGTAPPYNTYNIGGGATTATLEAGNYISRVELDWTLNHDVVSQSYNNGIGPIDPAARTYNHITTFGPVGTRTYTLTVSDGITISNTPACTINLKYRLYRGTRGIATLTDADIRALGGDFADSKAISIYMMPRAQYIYFAWPYSWGAPSKIIVNGMVSTGSFQMVRNDNFTNAMGYTYQIRLYRSDNLLTGNYWVEVQ